MPYTHIWTNAQDGWQKVDGSNQLKTDDQWMTDNNWYWIPDNGKLAPETYTVRDTVGSSGDNTDVIYFGVGDGDTGVADLQDEKFNLRARLNVLDDSVFKEGEFSLSLYFRPIEDADGQFQLKGSATIESAKVFDGGGIYGTGGGEANVSVPDPGYGLYIAEIKQNSESGSNHLNYELDLLFS